MFKGILTILSVFFLSSCAQEIKGSDSEEGLEVVEVPVELTVVYDDELGPELIFEIVLENKFNKSICFSEYYLPVASRPQRQIFSIKTKEGKQIPFLLEEEIFRPYIFAPYIILPPNLIFSSSIRVFTDRPINTGAKIEVIKDYDFIPGEHEYLTQFIGWGYFCEDLDKISGLYISEETGLERRIKLISKEVVFTFHFSKKD